MDSGKILTSEEFLQCKEIKKKLPKYNSAEEEKPAHAWYALDKARIENLLKDFGQSVTEVLRAVPANDRELQHLLRTADSLSNVERSPAKKVALVGPQGAGKSLLINAIFDHDGLSLTGADGAACTSVVIRYVLYPSPENPDSEMKFFAEVKFLDAKKIEAMLHEHTRCYYHYQNDDDDDSDDEENPRARGTRHDEMDRRLKDTAEDVFQTLFGSRENFLASWSASAFKNGEFLRLCQIKCQEAISSINANFQGVATYMAKDQQHLIAQIKPFLTEVKGETCRWPLVDNITVRFYHDLLNQNLEIIDLPGWGDINLQRARLADEIKDSVDVEMILGDTIRIASDDLVITTVRSGIAHHNATNVKLIATKIDAISPNQLAQCSGKLYDGIKDMISNADDEITRAEEDDDDTRSLMLARYKIYLERCLKQQKILERAQDITHELAAKLQGRSPNDAPQIFHVSASDYMDWIRTSMLNFREQPALSPQMTGLPAIRLFLFSLSAQQNLEDYSNHINFIIPSFICKIKRTVMDTDRDAGFRTIADELDGRLGHCVTSLLSDAKSAFKRISSDSLKKFLIDRSAYKKQVEDRLKKDWLTYRGLTFNKILKSRGHVPKGSSKAKGLEEGCNWNKELSNLLAPGFHKWYATHVACMKPMRPALLEALGKIHNNAISVINASAANLVTVEKAKKMWCNVRPKLQAKLMVLMDKVEEIEKHKLLWATMETDRENNLVASITDELFDEVFSSLPPLRENPTKKNKYVTPKIKFQKVTMENLFLKPEKHFVDNVTKHFQKDFDKTMEDLLDQQFTSISKSLEGFSKTLRDQAPIDYTITPMGQSLREDLKQKIPLFEAKSNALRMLLPASTKQEDESALLPVDSIEHTKSEGNLKFYYDEIAKRKHKTENKAKREPAVKRIKREHD